MRASSVPETRRDEDTATASSFSNSEHNDHHSEIRIPVFELSETDSDVIVAGKNAPAVLPWVADRMRDLGVMAHGSVCSAPTLVGLVLMALLTVAYYIVQNGLAD
jgi:hypothetical protein